MLLFGLFICFVLLFNNFLTIKHVGFGGESIDCI